MNKPARTLGPIRWLIWLIGPFVIVWVIGALVDYPRRLELGQAFERYLGAFLDAYMTFDSSKMSEVAVDPRLGAVVDGVEWRRQRTNQLYGEEFRDVEVHQITQYNSTEAEIVVRYDYRAFDQDLTTGIRTYGPSERWYWRRVKVVFVRVGQTWKVKEIYFLDWSG